MEAKVKKLDGITVIYKKNKINKATYAEFGILTGAFNEKIPGTAHFLEHMLFKQTKNRNEQQLIEDRSLLGINASTSHNYMKIYFNQSSKKIEDCFDICSDMYFNSVFSKEKLESERKVIEEEFLRGENSHIKQAKIMHTYNIYKEKRFLYSVLGSLKSIKSITSKDLETYKKENFFKENFFVSICSSKSFFHCKKLINKYISPNLLSNPAFKRVGTSEAIPKGKPFVKVITKTENTRNTIFLSISSIPYTFRDLYILQYIKNVLSLGEKSRCFNILRIQNSLIYSYPSIFTNSNETDLFYGIEISTATTNITKCLELLSNIFKDLRENGITEEEYNQIRENDKLANDRIIPEPNKYPSQKSMQWVSFGKIITQKEDIRIFNSISIQEINNLCKKLFDIDKVFMTVVGNATKKDVPTLTQLKKMFYSKK